MTPSRYWVLEDDWRTAEQINRFLDKTSPFGLEEQHVFTRALAPLYQEKPVGDFRNPAVPFDFPILRLRFPKHSPSPDYFHLGPVHLVSAKLRGAFALADTVVQYLPIELLTTDHEVRQQDYRWINLLAYHSAIDLQRSVHEFDEGIRHTTGETYRFIRSYERMVFRDDIPPHAELFRVAEDLTTILASDALAERVMRAGCTGISFEDPATYHNGGPIHRYRTATGIEEEDMNRIFPETP